MKLIKQLPGTKHTYKGRNPAGGIKCTFTQSREYSRKGDQYGPAQVGHILPSGILGVATKWGT